MKYVYENRIELRELDIPVSCYKRIGFNYIAHWHSDVEIAYVHSGKILVGVNNHTEVLEEGQGVLIQSADVHYYQCIDPNAEITIVVFGPELLTSTGIWPDGREFVTPFFDDREWGDKVMYYTDAIWEECSKKMEGYELYVKGIIGVLCGFLLRNHATRKRQITTKLQYERKKQNDIIRYVENHFLEEVSLVQLAEHFHMDKYWISKLFNASTGMNFRTYVNALRVERAKELMDTTTHSLVDIAIECGYNNVRTFNRAFHQRVGMAPSEYRKKGGDGYE